MPTLRPLALVAPFALLALASPAAHAEPDAAPAGATPATSSAGTDAPLLPPVSAAPASAGASPSATGASTSLTDSRGATAAPPSASSSAAPSASSTATPTSGTDDSNGALDKAAREKIAWLEHLKIGGYLQPQLIWVWNNAAASSNLASGALPGGVGANSTVAKADGTTTNNDFFKLRRARLKVEYMPTDAARFVMEIDPTSAGGPTGGVGTIARNVEAVGIIHWPGDIGTTEFGVGIFKIPFGYEVLQSDADRPFIERSWSENNLTPGEFDTGARAYSSFFEKHLTVQLAAVNGVTQGEKTFAVVPDLNKGKDVIGRINYNFGVFDVGASGLVGQGQLVDATALRFKNLPRKAVNLEAAVHQKFTEVGETRVYAELSRGQNLDRGTKYALGLPAIPTDVVNGTVSDLDEIGYFVRLEQDLTKWFSLALRYDFYTPNSAEGNDGRDTFGAVAVVHFTKGLEWRAEVAHATDNVHKPMTAAPHKTIDTLSNVLQARF